uniref:Putative kinesin n=1 Tax=Trypanosoma vivax (strain Y486) TaxID=1055687 RepID=G0U5A4_TRYVY|nr:putative kinesin, fragment [Trypanosoma vivax Y486]
MDTNCAPSGTSVVEAGDGRIAATSDYPDDGHIFVCLRIRNVLSLSQLDLLCHTWNSGSGGGAGGSNSNSGSTAAGGEQSATRRSLSRGANRALQRICFSAVENVVVAHDPKFLDDSACVVRDTDNVVQLLAARNRRGSDRPHVRKFLTSTGTASYFEFDACLVSMDADSMLRMPIVRNSDFIQPPRYGSQEDVYRTTAVHAVTAAVEGVNSCVFAYGQTGSGKTYTLFGDVACIHRDPGVVPRTIEDVFERVEKIGREYVDDTETDYSYRIRLSFFEIYQNEVHCLLSRKGPLRVSFTRDVAGKDVMTVHNLQQHTVANTDNALSLVEMGFRRRQTGETGMNAHSSRSHAILQINVTQWRTNRLTKESVELDATLNIVDLAGSERQKTAKTDGKSREEGIQINQSLTTLSRVINDISNGAKYVNFRDSLLTMVLRDNLGGNSRTFMIATIAPNLCCFQESCATMHYARDVRKIRNRPMINKTFQTRSSLLELNAVLKQDNEKLRKHIGSLLSKVREGGCTLEDFLIFTGEDAVKREISPLLGRVPTEVLSCHTGLKQGDVFTQTLTAATSGPAAPLIVTAHRRYTNVSSVGTSCIEGGKVGITLLTSDVVHFDLSDLVNGAVTGHVGNREAVERLPCSGASERVRGVVEFEHVSQRSCEHHYWLRYVPPEGVSTSPSIISLSDSANAVSASSGVSEKDNARDAGGSVSCCVNGVAFKNGDRWQLTHGDVLCIFLDGAGDTSEQSVLTFHYVDVNYLSHHGGGVNCMNVPDEQLAVHSTDNVPPTLEEEVTQLRRERAKLLSMLQQHERSIEYRTQRELELRSKLSSVVSARNSGNTRKDDDASLCLTPHNTGQLMWDSKDASPPPNPVFLLEGQFRSLVPPVTSTKKGVPGCAFQRSSGSSTFRPTIGSGLPLFEDAARPRGAFCINATREAVTLPDHSDEAANSGRSHSSTSLELADEDVSIHEQQGSEKSSRKGGDDLYQRATASTIAQAVSTVVEEEKKSDIPSVSLSRSALSVSQNAYPEERADQQQQQHHTVNAASESGSVAMLSSKDLVTADDILLNYKTDLGHEGSGHMHVFLSSSEGVRERHRGAKRERVLCERIWSLEQALADLRGAMGVLEGRLRIAQDTNTEYELRLAQLEGDFSDLSKSLNSVTMERTVLLKDVNALEMLLARTEEALNEASKVNEAEVNKRVSYMVEEGRALRVLARLWKRRAMARVAVELGANSNACRSSGSGSRLGSEEPFRSNKQLPWDDLRVESNVSRAKRLLGDCGGKLCSTVKADSALDNKSRKNRSALLEEQRRIIRQLQGDCDKLSASLSNKEDELRVVTFHLQERLAESELGGFRNTNELNERIETLISDGIAKSSHDVRYSSFPPDFQFSGEMIALIRLSLRTLLDRLKVELYVLNRQNLHKLSLLIPAVQLRPESQFRYFFHELRGVVGEIAGKTQRIGAKWSVEEGDILSGLVDHRRRRAGDSLSGLLIWYDHWDLAPKTEHIFYVELIRNREHVIQLARLVRQESRLNTNATSALHAYGTGSCDAVDAIPISSGRDRRRGKDNSVRESRQILERLNEKSKSSVLAKVAVKIKEKSASTQLMHTDQLITAQSTPLNRCDSSVLHLSSPGACFPPVSLVVSPSSTQNSRRKRRAGAAKGGKNRKSSDYSLQLEPETTEKFSRRTTAIVVPVSESDVTVAASTALARDDSVYNFSRKTSNARLPERETPSNASLRASARYGRTLTETLPTFAAFADLVGSLASPPSARRPPRIPQCESARNTQAAVNEINTPKRSLGVAFHRYVKQ